MVPFKNNKIFIEKQSDNLIIDKLLDDLFGSQRFKRTVYKFRIGPPIKNLSLVVKSYDEESKSLKILASIRYWKIKVSELNGLLLGPLAVRKDLQGLGFGKKLVKKTIKIAKLDNWKICFVSGEYNYFRQFGFEKISHKKLILPGYIEHNKFLVNFLEKKIQNKLGTTPWRVESLY